ncbi:hypothetical protein vseg_007827 [Gypsophila vaccaria]
MASISSIISPYPTLIQHKSCTKTSFCSQTHIQIPFSYNGFDSKLKNIAPLQRKFISVHAVATDEESGSDIASMTSTLSNDGDGDAVKRVYIGNIPRNVTSDELRRVVEEHGVADIVEVMYDKYSGRSRRFGFATMKTVEDANAVVEKLNDTEIGGRKIKVNITEKPLGGASISLPPVEDSQFVDSPHKVYVGNLAKTVTTEMLKNFFSDKGTVLSAKVQRTPGTSKSSGFGFVCFSSEDEVEAAIAALNNAALEGQKIRVNKA